MKKKMLAGLISVIFLISCVACGAKDGGADATENSGQGRSNAEDMNREQEPRENVKITLLGAGYGDKSYWDSAKAGAERLHDIYGDRVQVKIVDMSVDTGKWPAAMRRAAEGDTDLIITGSFQQMDNMEEIAPEYPDKDWVMFDSALDFDAYDLKHVYNMDYKANESGYLAGMVAAYMTTTDNEGINPEKTIGFIGGMDNNLVIHNFLIGYIEGAKAVEPDIRIVVSFLGTFDDVEKAKETAVEQYNVQNADVIFACAGSAGTGCIEAAETERKYIIGVDSDQTLLYEGQPEQDRIITSALKRVDESVIYVVGRYLDGDLPFGEREILGIKERAAGIVYNDILEDYVGEAVVKALKEAEEKITSGEIKVTASADMTEEQVNQLIESVQ